MKPDIIEFVTDPQLLGLSISSTQRTALKAFYGLPLSAEEHACWIQCTGRTSYPGRPFREGTFLCGARAGKDSRIATPVLAYEATYGEHDRALGKGEFGILPLVAQDQRATRIAFSYLKSAFTQSSLLASQVDDIGASEIKLTNRLSALCFPCTQSSLRGWSNPVGAMSEIAFYRLEGQADSDVEIQASIRRGMLSFPNPKLIKISTPYMKSGLLYQDFKRYYGQDSPDVLVWRASSILMNPSLKAERLAQEQSLDASRYAREYLAEFAEDLDTMFPISVVEAVVVPHRQELSPRADVIYVATCDPTGGATGPHRDTFTFTIVHMDGTGEQQRIVQDVLKGWQGADLAGIVREMVIRLRQYRISEIRGDKYAGAWVRQAFEREGIRYRDAEMDKSTAYLEAEPLLTQGRVELLDHPQLVRELTLLERRPRPQGRTLVDHPSGGHDDYANSTCVAIPLLSKHAMVRPFGFSCDGVTITADPLPSPSPVASGVGQFMEQTAALAMTIVDTVRGAGSSLRATVTPPPPPDPFAHGSDTQQYWWNKDAQANGPQVGMIPLRTDDGEIARGVKAHGCYFPGDAIPAPPGRTLSDVLDGIHEKFRRWR